MRAKLKYLGLLSCVACLATSCSSDIPDIEEVGKGPAMSFAVADLTRATVTNSINKFAVYGDMKLPGDKNSSPLIVFNKTEVTYTDNGWKYAGIQYWYPKHEHSFVALIPVSVLDASASTRYFDSRLTFTYSIPTSGNGILADRGDVTDIIAATHRRLYSESDIITTTTFRFGHIMSLINVAPQLDDNEMNPDEILKIHKLELLGFSTIAEFTVLPAELQSNRQTDDRLVNVSAHEGQGNLSITFDTPKIITNHSDKVNLFDPDDSIIMIPQTFASDSEAKMVLTYTINDEVQESKLIVPLKLLKWESGSSYTYCLLFDKMGLKLQTVVIEDWKEIKERFDSVIE